MPNSTNSDEQKCPHLAQQAANTAAILPDITTPLISETNQPVDTTSSQLGHLSSFIGTWNSPRDTNATGYNVMPLPEIGAPNGKGYITKNFPYYEEITFSPIAGGAPNREGNYTQTSGVLFYEQRVYIANNTDPSGNQPIQDTLVHAENGSWLYHTIIEQTQGAFGPGTVTPPNPLPTQDPATQYNKQVSVPHGNSILMVGSPIATGTGNPTFSTTDKTVLPFTDPTIKDPVTALSDQLTELNNEGITVLDYTSIKVDSVNPGGGVTNIVFENRNSKVTSMDTTWYIENLSNGAVQLQYVQNIWLEFPINNVITKFVHVDANTLKPAGIVNIDSTKPWQDSGFIVKENEPAVITYQSGLWTADPHRNNGNLYDANGDASYKVNQTGYPLQNVNMGALIGKVGTNPPFLIGNGPIATPAGQTGPLQLCINDDLDGLHGAGLTDNVGSVQVSINVS